MASLRDKVIKSANPNRTNPRPVVHAPAPRTPEDMQALDGLEEGFEMSQLLDRAASDPSVPLPQDTGTGVEAGRRLQDEASGSGGGTYESTSPGAVPSLQNLITPRTDKRLSRLNRR